MTASRSFLSGIFLVIIGAILLGLSAWQITGYLVIPDPSQNTTISEHAIPAKITVSRLGILDLPILPAKIANGVWEVSDVNANFLISSSPLAQGGHTIIYGHNKEQVLGKLKSVVVGDRITLTDQNGNNYHYFVSDKMTLKSSDVAELMKVKGETLTIYTCAGWFDRERFAVRGKPI